MSIDEWRQKLKRLNKRIQIYSDRIKTAPTDRHRREASANLAFCKELRSEHYALYPRVKA